MGERHSKRPKLTAPYYDDGRGEIYFEVYTAADKIVHDYTGLDFLAIEELDLVTYLIYFRDGVIHRHLQTVEGQEYLKNCWRLAQSEPDRKKLRKNFSKKA